MCISALPSLSLSCHQLDLTNQLRNPFIRILCICSEKTDKCKKTQKQITILLLSFTIPLCFALILSVFLWDSGRLKTGFTSQLNFKTISTIWTFLQIRHSLPIILMSWLWLSFFLIRIVQQLSVLSVLNKDYMKFKS